MKNKPEDIIEQLADGKIKIVFVEELKKDQDVKK